MGQYLARRANGTPVIFRISGEAPNPVENERINKYLTEGPAVTAPAKEQVKAEEPGMATVFGRSVARGWNETQAGVDAMVQSAFEGLGDAARAKEWEEAAQSQRKERDSYEIPEGGLGTSIVSGLGTSAPAMAAGIGTGYLGAQAGAVAGSTFGPVGTLVGAGVGGVIGAGLSMLPQTLNANAERQIEEHGYVKDWGKAYGAAGTSAVIEGIGDRVGLKVVGAVTDSLRVAGKALPSSTTKVIQDVIKNKALPKALTIVAKKVGTGSALGLVTGATEEVLQQGLERWQAELPLMDDKSAAEYIESALVGGITEAIFGAGAGVYGARKQIKDDRALTDAEEELKADAARLATAREKNQQYQAKKVGYEEDQPGLEDVPPVKKPIPGQLALPDYSSPSREQTYTEQSHRHDESNLPPGLRDEEVGTDPLSPVMDKEDLPTAASAIASAVDPSGVLGGTDEERAAARADRLANFQAGHDAYNQAIAAGKGHDVAREAMRAVRDQPAIPIKQQTITPAKEVKSVAATPVAAPTTATPKINEQQGPAVPPFSEDEYRAAIVRLRDEGTLSHDKIAKTLGVSKPQAAAYFKEMLDRNDAYPAGNFNQYAKITVPHGMTSRKQSDVRGKMQPYRSRDFVVKPVKPAGQHHPFSVHLNGKRIGQKGGRGFATRQEAQDYIDSQVPAKAKKNATVVEDNATLQYGIHELHYEHKPDKEQHLVGERVVNTFSSEAEAREAIKEYDPAYSPESNKWRERQTPEQRQAKADADLTAELGGIKNKLTEHGTTVLGPGRLELGIAPRIVNPNNPNSIVEGTSDDLKQNNPQGVKKVIGNIITLAADLYDPSLSVEERTKKMEEVLNHELVHALRGLDLLTKKEWDTLFHHAASAKVPGKTFTWLQRAAVRNKGANGATVSEEAIAEMVRGYINDPTSFRNPERGLLRRIADFIKKMMKLSQRHDAADLIDTIFSGGIADREVGHGGLGERSKEDTFYSMLKPDNFYLKTERFINTVKQDKAPPAQWKAMLKNAGIKEEERNWLGLDDWLDESGKEQKTIEKKAIQKFLAANQGIEIRVLASQNHPELGADAQRRSQDDFGQAGYSYGNDPDYEKMQTPGGKDYFEAIFSFTPKKGEPTYYNNHYPFENMLAHARLKTVMDKDGRKILFIEEIQSDLHQDAGKYGGYYTDGLKRAEQKAWAANSEAKAAATKAWHARMEVDRQIANVLEDKKWVQKEIAFRQTNQLSDYGDLFERRDQLEQQARDLIKPKRAAEAAYNEAEKAASDSYKEAQKIQKRMGIPNAPYKTNWEDYVIKRLIRHAAEHDFDGVAWHGQPESVAAVEKWPNLQTEQTETGPKHFLGERMAGSNEEDTRPNVTSIVNRYLEKLPRIVRKLANAFGASVEMNDADPSVAGPAPYKGSDYEPPTFAFDEDFHTEYPTKGSIKSKLYSLKAALGFEPANQPVHYKAQQQELVQQLGKAYQIAMNQRGDYDPVDAFERAGLAKYNYNSGVYEAEGLKEIAILTHAENTWKDVEAYRNRQAGPPITRDKKFTGSFAYKHIQLNLNRDMKESFASGNQTRFSQIEARAKEVQADPRFQEWFGQSVVSHEDDTPRVVYHSTRAPTNFGRFNRMSHFGSVNAANERLMDERDNQTEYDENERIFPVFLNLHRPLKVIDTGVQHDVQSLVSAAQREGAISFGTVTKVLAMEPFSKRKATDMLVKALEKSGYDGLYYVNRVEDPGSVSYVTFHENQIKSVFNQGKWSNDPDIMYSQLEERGADLQKNNDKFKHWFTGSKIVNDDGTPMMMFHGTNRNFDTFDLVRGKRAGYADFGKGHYFAATPQHAEFYAGRHVETANKPNAPKDQVLGTEPGQRAYDFAGAHIIPAFLSIKNPYIYTDSAPLFSKQEAHWFTKKLKEYGYDGVIAYQRTVDEYGDVIGPRHKDNGIAEIVAFESNQIKSALSEEFDTEENSYKYSQVTAPQYLQTAPMGQRVPLTPPIDQLSEVHNRMTYDNLSKPIHKLIEWTIPGAGRQHKVKEVVDSGIIGGQDRMLSIGRLIDRIKKNGGFISNENDTYLREQLYSSQTDAHLTANDRDYYKPMLDAIQALHVTQRDFDEAKTLDAKVATILNRYKANPKHALAELYLYAQHAQERNTLMRKRNERLQGDRPQQYEAGSGLGDGTAQAVLQWFDSKPFAREFNDPTNANSIRSRMREIIKSTNDIRVGAGLTIDFRTTMGTDGQPLDPYIDYVPIRGRIDEEATWRGEDDDINDFFAKTGKGFNIRGKEDFSALGRESLGQDLIAHAVMQNQETIVRAGKNKVAQSFRKLILDNPGEMESAAHLIDMPRTKYAYDGRRGVVRQVPDLKVQNDPTVLKGKVDGQQFYIQMVDPRIVKAMGAKSGLGSGAHMNSVIRGLAYVNRFLAATRTSYNPEFMIANMLRDLQAAMINLSEHEQKGVRSKVMASVLPALNGVRKALRSGDRTSEWGKVYEEFQRHGGHTAVFGIRGLSDTIEHINKELSVDASGSAQKVIKPIKAIGKFVNDYNLAIENGTRLAAYRTLRDKYLELSGDPHDPQNQKRAREMAAFAAKNLTVNFNMGGEIKPVMTAFYMFFNASMQGSMALLNPFIRSRKMKKVWASVLVAGAVQDMLMSMLSPEDDDGEKTYDKIPEHVLEHNMIFMDPFGMSERGYFKIPMPYLMNGIYNWGRALSRTSRGGYDAGELMKTGSMTMVDSLNPWGGSNSFLNFVAPTLVDPVVDLSMNEDFTGKPIAPPVSPYEATGENRSQQFWNNTNPAFVKVADWLSQLTGRQGDYMPGTMEYSPNQVEYVVDWVSGGTGTFLARAGYLVYGGVTGELPEMEIESTDLPFLRKAYGSITKKNDLQDYIEGRDQVLRVRKALRDARKEGDNEGYMKIMRKYPDEYKVAARINALENARKKLSTKIKKIRESKRLPEERKEEMVKRLKDRQDMLIGRGNEVLAVID